MVGSYRQCFCCFTRAEVIDGKIITHGARLLSRGRSRRGSPCILRINIPPAYEIVGFQDSTCVSSPRVHRYFFRDPPRTKVYRASWDWCRWVQRVGSVVFEAESSVGTLAPAHHSSVGEHYTSSLSTSRDAFRARGGLSEHPVGIARADFRLGENLLGRGGELRGRRADGIRFEHRCLVNRKHPSTTKSQRHSDDMFILRARRRARHEQHERHEDDEGRETRAISVADPGLSVPRCERKRTCHGHET